VPPGAATDRRMTPPARTQPNNGDVLRRPPSRRARWTRSSANSPINVKARSVRRCAAVDVVGEAASSGSAAGCAEPHSGSGVRPREEVPIVLSAALVPGAPPGIGRACGGRCQHRSGTGAAKLIGRSAHLVGYAGELVGDQDSGRLIRACAVSAVGISVSRVAPWWSGGVKQIRPWPRSAQRCQLCTRPR
jgi:hypothetical protein